jgi:hypothetical protein
MFTVKFYSHDPNGPGLGYRQLMFHAETLTILRDNEGAEITMHFKDGTSRRIDIRADTVERDPNWPPAYVRAIIENMFGKTSEIIDAHDAPTKQQPAVAA